MKRILVYIASDKNELKRSSCELISAGVELASKCGAEIMAVGINIPGEICGEISNYGISNITNIASEQLLEEVSVLPAKAISDFASKIGADCLLFSATTHGMEISPRVSAILNAGYVAEATALDYSDGELIISKSIYSGKASAKLRINSGIKVISLRANQFPIIAAEAIPNVEVFVPAFDSDDISCKIKQLISNEGRIDVSEADIIVAGGRGMKSAENFSILEDLASKINAAVGASRAVVDAGWRPHSEQIGQTGKTVSPNLYIACGISGAVQHRAGMEESAQIISINNDRNAPINSIADYVILGDVAEIVPKMIKYYKANSK